MRMHLRSTYMYTTGDGKLHARIASVRCTDGEVEKICFFAKMDKMLCYSVIQWILFSVDNDWMNETGINTISNLFALVARWAATSFVSLTWIEKSAKITDNERMLCIRDACICARTLYTVRIRGASRWKKSMLRIVRMLFDPSIRCCWYR